MLQKITNKLIATLVATITAFTLLFLAQPAQARFEEPFYDTARVTVVGESGDRHTVTVPAGFDLGKCIGGGLKSFVGLDSGAAVKGVGRILRIIGTAVRVVVKTARAVSGVGTVINVAEALVGCLRDGIVPERTYRAYIPTPYDVGGCGGGHRLSRLVCLPN